MKSLCFCAAFEFLLHCLTHGDTFPSSVSPSVCLSYYLLVCLNKWHIFFFGLLLLMSCTPNEICWWHSLPNLFHCLSDHTFSSCLTTARLTIYGFSSQFTVNVEYYGGFVIHSSLVKESKSRVLLLWHSSQSVRLYQDGSCLVHNFYYDPLVKVSKPQNTSHNGAVKCFHHLPLNS